MSIDYGSLPRLRSRLTQSRSALLWKPWIFGRKDSHLPLATHSGILSSINSTAPFGTASSLIQCSSTNPDVTINNNAVTICPQSYSHMAHFVLFVLRTSYAHSFEFLLRSQSISLRPRFHASMCSPSRNVLLQIVTSGFLSFGVVF